MTCRFEELDSLRGLAALSVLTGHYLQVFHSVVNLNSYVANDIKQQFIYALKFTPLHFLWGGHEAVIFFFVLSGFVLALPFLNGEKVAYNSFLIKRICRIYIPYYFAIFFSIILRITFSTGGGIESLTYWFNSMWVAPINPMAILQHLLLIGDFNSTLFDGTIWSLVHEIRISIIFPIIMLIVMRFNWKISLSAGILVSYVGCSLINLYLPNYSTNFYLSLHYMAMFIVGALLAKNRVYLVNLLRGSAIIQSVIALLGFGAYTYAWWVFREISAIHNVFINDWFICLGTVIFILYALSSASASRFLKRKPILLLGKMSFSVYLYHVPILMACVYIFYQRIPMWSILAISFISTIIVSFTSYLYIEKFSVNIGRHILLKKKPKELHFS